MKTVDKQTVEATFKMLSEILYGDAFIIWDTVDEELVSTIEPYGFEEEFGLRINQTVLYSSNPSIDNGYYDTAKHWKEKMKRYKIVPCPTKELAQLLKKQK